MTEEKELKNKVSDIIKVLGKAYPDPHIELDYKTPLELLIATILAAQSTDKRVNIVTKTLFKKYKTPEDYANADLPELEQDIKSTGFYRNKAKSIKNACKVLVEKYHSQVPNTMEELLTLPGVGRKTANVVLGNAYGKTEGIAVDTHVKRLTRVLGLTKETDPVKIEQDLMKIVPKEHWIDFSNRLVLLGRRVCTARKPSCDVCSLTNNCPASLKA